MIKLIRLGPCKLKNNELLIPNNFGKIYELDELVMVLLIQGQGRVHVKMDLFNQVILDSSFSLPNQVKFKIQVQKGLHILNLVLTGDLEAKKSYKFNALEPLSWTSRRIGDAQEITVKAETLIHLDEILGPKESYTFFGSSFSWSHQGQKNLVHLNIETQKMEYNVPFFVSLNQIFEASFYFPNAKTIDFETKNALFVLGQLPIHEERFQIQMVCVNRGLFQLHPILDGKRLDLSFNIKCE